MKISTVRNVLENIYNAMVKLPKPIRRVCLVQVFAFMGWCVDYTIITSLFSLIPRPLGSRFCSIRSFFFSL
jgi:hypothetical protein